MNFNLDSSVTGRLYLYHTYLGTEGAKELAEALKANHSLAHLCLGGDNIGPKGAKELAKALKINKTITNLGARHDNIGPEGAKELAEALKINQSIIHLELNGNDIGDEGTKKLAEALKINQSITCLNLAFNNMGAEGAKALAEALKDNHSLTHLYLANNNIGNKGAKELAEALQTNKIITSLSFSGYNIESYEEQQIDELLKRNKEYIQKVAKWIYGKFIENKVEEIPLRFLKIYQVCDQDLLEEYIKNLDSKDSAIFDKCIAATDHYIGENFWEMSGVAKNIQKPGNDNFGTSSPFSLPELSSHISSFLGKNSLWQISDKSPDDHQDNIIDLAGNNDQLADCAS